MKITNKIILIALVTLIPLSLSPSLYNSFKEKSTGMQTVEAGGGSCCGKRAVPKMVRFPDKWDFCCGNGPCNGDCCDCKGGCNRACQREEL